MNSFERYAVVIGSMNMDICAKAYDKLISNDSNPGKVSLSPGGVGRNIAQNLSQLGTKVVMLSVLGNDANAVSLEKSCIDSGIDISHILKSDDGNTPTYVFIAGADGDMALAVCDAEMSGQISPDYLKKNIELINNAAAVVIETNISAEAIKFLVDNCESPIFADPVSVTKGKKLIPVVGRLHTLKPNRIEAELLSGTHITDEASLMRAAEVLLSAGLKRVFISLGTDGLFYADKTQSFNEACVRTSLVNATGGGDAMMAAVVKAFMEDMPPRETARFALAASAICVESRETINPELNFEHAMSRAGLTKNGGSHGF